MGKRKHKPPKHPSGKNPQALPPMPEKQSKSLVWLQRLGAGALGLLTVAGFIFNFIPKLSVDVGGSLQSANPMSTVFYLSNDGLLPVHSLVVACGAPQLTAGRYELNSEPDARFLFSDSKAEILSPGHRMTLPCAHIVGVADPATITMAEITIIVDYRPDWIPWHKTARFPWKAEKTLDSGWVWKSIPR